MQIGRLFEIVYILMRDKNTTASQLAQHFEVSVRTIYRDIDTLCASGIPIYTTKGKGGGIRLMEEFVLDKSLLSTQEQQDILSALQGLKATRYPTTRQVLTKLSGLFGADTQSWIEVDFNRWGDEQKELFAYLKSAVINKQIVAFSYYNAQGEQSSRQVEPLQLWYKETGWYLKAYCLTKNGYRLFKMSRIKDLKVLDENFTRRMPAKDTFGEQDPSQYVTVKLRLSQSVAYRVYDEFAPEAVRTNEDGSFTVTASYPEDNWLYGYLLSFGEGAEVLAPREIRDRVVEKMSLALENYKAAANMT